MARKDYGQLKPNISNTEELKKNDNLLKYVSLIRYIIFVYKKET